MIVPRPPCCTLFPYTTLFRSRLYVRAWQWTKEPFFAQIANEIFGFVQRELTAPSGAFYATLDAEDRKSTRLNSSHLVISYAVFCLKKKKLYSHIAYMTDEQLF